MAARLCALRDDQVDARLHLLDGVLLGADQRGDRDTAFPCPPRSCSPAARPAHWAISLIGLAERHLEQVLSGVADRQRRAGPWRRLRFDVVRREQVGDETAVVLGDPAASSPGANFSPLPSNFAGTMRSMP